MRSCQNDKTEAEQSTKYDGTASNEQIRKGQPLKPYLTPYFTSKLKDIASKIRSNACKRFRTKDYDGQVRFVFWSEFKQINDASKDKNITVGKEDLTIKELESLTKRKRAKLFQSQNANLEKKKRIEAVLISLNTELNCRKKIEKELSKLKINNKRVELQTFYWKQLCLQRTKSQLACKQIQAQIQKTQREMDRVKNCIKQIPRLDRLIIEKQAQYQLLSKKLLQLEQKVEKLINEGIPNQEQMIHCMFYIGILTEQIQILLLQKKQKQNQKLQNDKVVNKSFKIHQKLARREIHIQCNNKETVELKTLIAIYMHCKSLTISNIVTVMNTLSFFSDQFKEIYSYQLFKQYFSILIERLKLHSIKQVQCNVQNNEAQLLKRKLSIIAPQQYLQLIKWVLQIYQIGKNTYSLYLCPYQMIVEVKAQDNDDLCQKQEVTLGEYNQLKIHFANSPFLTSGKLKSK